MSSGAKDVRSWFVGIAATNRASAGRARAANPSRPDMEATLACEPEITSPLGGRSPSRKLKVERTKLNAGRSSNFRLVRFEDDLVRSQNNEIGAITAYLNALTALDRTQMTTLETWGLEIDAAYDASGAP